MKKSITNSYFQTKGLGSLALIKAHTRSLALLSSLSCADTCSETRLHMSVQEYRDSAESGEETYTCPVSIR